MKYAVSTASILLASCAAIPPQTYPEMDRETARDVVVVARTQPGDYLPQFPQCERQDVICMDPPPFWFRARVVDVVFGSLRRAAIVAATTSHYGLQSFGATREPALLRLAIDSSAVVMPRYSEAALHADRRGELFVVLDSPAPIWWLPCSVMEVAVEIDASDFDRDLLIPFERISEEDAASGEEFLERTERGFLPKKALPVARIERHLRSRYAGNQLPECRQE